jgi:cysteine sulfinate desulfinase/cysteine desulfurase-like protein
LSKDLYRDIIVVSSIEHKSINETVLKELGFRGYDIIKLPVDADGKIIMEDLIKVVEQNKDQVCDILYMWYLYHIIHIL